MGLHRTHRKRKDREDAADTRVHNKAFKIRERKRRNNRMIRELRSGSLPYAPGIMSWLSRELEKPASKITAKDVTALLA